jgi:hypothetical protein
MNFLHYDLQLNAGDVVQVTLDRQANVRLLDEANFQSYQQGLQHRYFGGLAKVSPARVVAPQSGHWHLVVDLGGYAGTVTASISVLSR